MHVLYYITSHGFGHAVRSAAIMNALHKARPDVKLTIKSDVDAKFFKEELTAPHNVIKGKFDIGCLQTDGLTVKIEETLAAYSKISARNKTLLHDEARFCRDNKIDCIVSDIVPFAFDVADTAQIPSIAISNFTWHDIYLPYVLQFPKYEETLSEMAKQYEKATLALALYPSFQMQFFKNKISVPTVCQKGQNKKREIFEKFGIDKNKNLALIYTGNFGLDNINWRALEDFDNWEFVGVYPIAKSPKNFHLAIKRDFRYIDLSASADVMVAKMGYGVFSESLAYRIPLVYPPRKDFAEFEVLNSEAQRLRMGYKVCADNFASGNWADVFFAAVSMANGEIETADTNGAQLCAAEIIKISSSKI